MKASIFGIKLQKKDVQDKYDWIITGFIRHLKLISVLFFLSGHRNIIFQVFSHFKSSSLSNTASGWMCFSILTVVCHFISVLRSACPPTDIFIPESLSVSMSSGLRLSAVIKRWLIRPSGARSKKPEPFLPSLSLFFFSPESSSSSKWPLNLSASLDIRFRVHRPIPRLSPLFLCLLLLEESLQADPQIQRLARQTASSELTSRQLQRPCSCYPRCLTPI